MVPPFPQLYPVGEMKHHLEIPDIEKNDDKRNLVPSADFFHLCTRKKEASL